MGLGIPPLRIKIMLELNPLKPTMLVGGLGIIPFNQYIEIHVRSLTSRYTLYVITRFLPSSKGDPSSRSLEISGSEIPGVQESGALNTMNNSTNEFVTSVTTVVIRTFLDLFPLFDNMLYQDVALGIRAPNNNTNTKTTMVTMIATMKT